MIVTGSHSHHLFPVTSNHSQVFLPEQLVLHIDEYTKQKQEDNTTEAKEAKKWGMSVEEYRAQMEMLSKGNEEIHKDHDNRPILINNQQNEENLATGGKPSVPIGKDKMQLQKEGYKIIQREQKRKQSLEDYMYEVIERGFKEVLVFHYPFSFHSSDRITRSTCLSPISSCASERTSFGISFFAENT